MGKTKILAIVVAAAVGLATYFNGADAATAFKLVFDKAEAVKACEKLINAQ